MVKRPIPAILNAMKALLRLVAATLALLFTAPAFFPREFLNSTFVNIDSLRRAAGEPTVDMHPIDAEARGIGDGERVVIFNARGRFEARAQVGPTVKQGTLMSPSIWWNRYTRDKVNCNATTSTKLTDFGGGATFFDNLVEVKKATSV